MDLGGNSSSGRARSNAMQITTEEDVREDNIVHTQVSALKTAMMWPTKTDRPLVKALVHLYFWFTSVTLVVSTVCLLLKAIKTSDLVDRSEAMDIFTLTFSAFYKLMYFVLHHDRFRNLVERMERNFPQRPLVGESSLTIKDWMRWSYPLTKVHCFVGGGTMFFWGCCPILSYLFGNVSWEDMPLPMNVWYPFDSNHGVQYVLLYIAHHFGLTISLYIYMCCDALLFSIVHFVCGQIEFIKESLNSIEMNRSNGDESEDQAKHEAFKKCAQQHADLLLFLKDLDVIFRTNIVADVLHAIISLSFAMFQTTEAKDTLAQIKMVIFVGVCFLHQYLNSFFGQSLINQQESLLTSVYGLRWTGRSIPFQKSVLIMMGGGCIKPVKLSAWRMYFLQYETFVDFCRAMVSFFMVLRTMQDQGIIEM